MRQESSESFKYYHYIIGEVIKMAQQQVETELHKWGGLFRNTSKAGNVYYSGTLEIDGKKRTVVMYRNDYWKDGEQKPYFNLNEKVPKGGNTASQDMMD